MMTKLATVLLTVFCISVPAIGQTLDCSQFRHNEDGSWTPIGQLTVTSNPYGGQIYVGPRVFVGINLATKLEALSARDPCLAGMASTRVARLLKSNLVRIGHDNAGIFG